MKSQYQNPVYPDYFADPFVLRVDDTFYAYGTGGSQISGRQFPVLRSRDLIRWESLGHALHPLDPPAKTYWAPEGAAKDGQYFLYYSASMVESDEGHRLRVATARAPEGPFVDSGRPLMDALGFSIDASPFLDPQSGRHYLFFARDFESDDPHGTGISCVRLAPDLLSVEGPARTVVRASAPWQIYERDRNYKGRVWNAWYCVEGPNVLYHGGRYYCLYSAGAWYGDNYGVGFAVADSIEGPWRDDMAANGPTVLRGVPGKVIGPGHNSVVLGPDGSTLFMVYHAWDAAHTARRMCIDPLRWTDRGPRVDGPSTEPRPIELPESVIAR